MSLATEERAALCDLFDEIGPNEPTLCTGWQTRDLAAHLVIRARRADGAPGILLKPLAGYTRRVQDSYARRPWRELVDLVRNGPAPWWPTRIPALDKAVNSIEFFIHHEDTRRGQAGLVLHRPDGQEIVVKRAPESVTVSGEPGELLLFATGRAAVRVEFDGDRQAIEAVQGFRRRL